MLPFKNIKFAFYRFETQGISETAFINQLFYSYENSVDMVVVGSVLVGTSIGLRGLELTF